MGPPRHRRPSLPVRVALAVAACALVGPADAKAGCGDYVQILGADGRPVAQDHAPPPDAPCHGPQCSGQVPPAVPPAPPAPTAGPQTQLDALLAAADPPDPARSAGLVAEPPLLPSVLSSSVFRPPRFPVNR